MLIRYYLAMAIAVRMASAGMAQTIQWSFGCASPGVASPTADTADYVWGGDVTNGNWKSATAMLSSTSESDYAGASKQMNACVVASTNAFSAASGGSAYFEFSLTPSLGFALAVTNLSFGSRGTSTGPQAFCVRSSLDGYAADLAAGTLENDGKWAMKTVALAATSTVAGASVTFRIYGYNGAGSVSSSANWRMDDLAVAVRAIEVENAVPPSIEPVPAQSVRVGQALALGLTITPTDGDPVTYTNATATVAVAGAWSLAGGLFSYVPVAADVGVRSFVVAVADKDGTNTTAITATVLPALVVAVRMMGACGCYAQDFNGLATNGDANVWNNASVPLESWFAYANATEITAYRTGTGSVSAGGLYSFGSSATNEDRSLGSLAGNGAIYRYGVAFTNETGHAITGLTVSFTAEQWRVANAATNTLTFDYCITNAVLPLNTGLWHPVRALCFHSTAVTNAGQGSGAIYQSARVSAKLAYPIAQGQVVLLRWSDEDDADSDHGFGIDDLAVAWSAGPLPDAIPVGRAGVSENFDEMGSSAVAELPHLWRIETRDDAPRVSGAYATAARNTMNMNAAGTFTHAGSYNFTSSEAYDQAVGGLSASNAAQTVTVSAKFLNAANMPVRRWSVRYAVEKYRNGTVGSAVRLLSSRDGETWSVVGEPTAFETDENTNGYAADARPGATVMVERQAVFDAPIAESGVFYLAWQIATAAGSASADAQALAIDGVAVAPSCSRKNVLLVR